MAQESQIHHRPVLIGSYLTIHSGDTHWLFKIVRKLDSLDDRRHYYYWGVSGNEYYEFEKIDTFVSSNLLIKEWSLYPNHAFDADHHSAGWIMQERFDER